VETGGCEIEAEIVGLNLAGVFNPNCFLPEDERVVTIMIDPSPNHPTLGTLTSGENLGDPDWPVASIFDVQVHIDIGGMGALPHLIPDLGALLTDDNLWDEVPCVDPSGPYVPPSEDHAHIPCPPETASPPGDGLRTVPLGCCWIDPQTVFITYEALCELLSGEYTRDAVDCADCTETSVEDLPAEGIAIGNVTPNPSSGTVRISYRLDADVKTQVDLYDTGGRLVRSFPLGQQQMGQHEFIWDGKDEKGRDLSAGVYFMTLRAGGVRTTKGIVLMR
jgi:hypothetical protein